MEYSQTARKRLGRAMRQARLQAGFSRREDFASTIGRSARQVQALENGESGVGPATWSVAATGLGWALDEVYAILDGDTERDGMLSSVELATVSDEDLAAEVLRRMKAGDGVDRDTAPTSDMSELSEDERTVPLKRVARHRPGPANR